MVYQAMGVVPLQCQSKAMLFFQGLTLTLPGPYSIRDRGNIQGQHRETIMLENIYNSSLSQRRSQQVLTKPDHH